MCLTQGCHKPSICKKNEMSAKCNKVKHDKIRYACITVESKNYKIV